MLSRAIAGRLTPLASPSNGCGRHFQRFLESFYFQYGHASIDDLGHLTVCFEGVSELAATEIEDGRLWDGEARSSRYQNFGKGLGRPPEFTSGEAERYRTACEKLLDAYHDIHAGMVEYYRTKLPRPAEMKPDAYERNIAARAFDVSGYSCSSVSPRAWVR